MNRTIYLHADEDRVWMRARELSGGHISGVIVEALKKYIAEREASACKGCGRP